jgi:predicted phosphatase
MSTISDSTEQKDSNKEISDSLKYNDESMALKIPSFNEIFSKFHLKIVKPHPWVDYKMMISKPDPTMDYKMLIKGSRRSSVIDIELE